MSAPTVPVAVAPQRRKIAERRTGSDQAFRLVATTAGGSVFAIMALIGFFLAYRSQDAFSEVGFGFFTETAWEPGSGRIGVAALLLGTVQVGLTAIVIAIPLSIGTALYISEFAPRKMRKTLISIVDLMAAVPSVVYGLWGLFLLRPNIIGISRWLSDYFGWIPIFKVEGKSETAALQPGLYNTSTFLAGVVVAMMVIPIVTSIMREVFSQAPAGEREAAYALGATRWGMIRTVVLPFGRGGMIGGTMLGLGRALGETIAVYFVISFAFEIKFRILESDSNTVSAHIAQTFGDASPLSISGLMAAGLVLFLLTLLVNGLAAVVVARSRSGATTEI